MDDLTSINIGRGAGVNTVFTQERLNTILGVLAGNTNTSGNNNTFIGYTAGYNNTDGVENVFLGLAGISNTSGSQNTFIGNLAGMMNTTGNLNTAVGFRALYSNTGTGEGGQGNQEVAVGAWALENSISRGNVAVGPAALRNLEIGGDNVAVGGAALHNVVSGGSNTAIGSAAMLYTGATANNNVAIGRSAGERSRGDHNSFVGANSGFNVREGFANILIGSVSQASDSVAINQIVIGANADGVADNTVVLGNESVTDVYMGEDSGATVHAGMIALNMINESPSPTPGTIRWNGSDFVGWNGINWISLTGGAKVGELIDQDNNTYKTIIIGGQEWMAENLRVSTYKEGTPIDQITNDAIWSGLTAAAWCYYDNNPSFNEPYGKLYNWFAISGIVYVQMAGMYQRMLIGMF